ncbi:DUF6221 family protein [Streptomyces sp. NPDC057494]|uniref:DUF6221 family protein n=1 Tax=Streptomyces sp. NPDC057494 TaxID=3346148 RepID=UPI00367DCA65
MTGSASVAETDRLRRLLAATGSAGASGSAIGACRPLGRPCAGLLGFHPTIAQHVALHDPARILREVEAKRRILARHARDPRLCSGYGV